MDKFKVIRDYDDPILANYALFLKQNGIEIAGIEFIKDKNGEVFTYDVNTNTNYNAQAELAAKVPVTGMQAVARFLGEELAKQRARATAA